MSMTESERYTWWDDGEAYSNYIRPAVTKRLAEYEDIGTVSEFQQLKEKATAKKPIPYVPDCTSIRFLDFVCPNCKEKVSDILVPKYCNCGQKLLWNWSEGKE